MAVDGNSLHGKRPTIPGKQDSHNFWGNRASRRAEGYTWLEIIFHRKNPLLLSKILILYGLLIFAQALPADENSHEALIKQLFLILELPQIYEQKVDALVSEQKRRIEHFSFFEDVIRNWAVETIGWRSLQPRLLEVYKNQLSEQEVRDILRFYRSSAGQKFLKVQPVIYSESRQLATDAARKNADQLLIMLKKRSNDLERKGVVGQSCDFKSL